VLEGFENIHAFISELYPRCARKFEALPLSDDEKTAAMDRISHTHAQLTIEVAAAYIRRHGQMHEEMATTVLANAGDLQSIARALFPVDRASQEPAVVMPVSDDMAQRRLHAKVDAVSGIMPQARALLEGPEVRLDDKMPKAPSRLLFDSTPTSAPNLSFLDHLLIEMLLIEMLMGSRLEGIRLIGNNFLFLLPVSWCLWELSLVSATKLLVLVVLLFHDHFII
jgi:hypothetical protein